MYLFILIGKHYWAFDVWYRSDDIFRKSYIKWMKLKLAKYSTYFERNMRLRIGRLIKLFEITLKLLEWNNFCTKSSKNRRQKPFTLNLALCLWNYALFMWQTLCAPPQSFVRRTKLSKNNMADLFQFQDQTRYLDIIVCLCFHFLFRNLNIFFRLHFNLSHRF